MQTKKETVIWCVTWAFLCSYFMQLWNFPNILTVFLGAVICLILVIKQKCIRINLGIILLTITLVSYYVIANGIRGMFYLIAYIPLILYVLGNYMACYEKTKIDVKESLFLLTMAIVIGYTVHGLLNSYMYFAGYRMEGKRQWFDIWQGTYLPGTQQVVYYLPALSLFLPAILFLKKRKWCSVFIIVNTMIFCYTSLATRSRMSLVIFLIVFVMQAVVYLLLEKDTSKKVIFNSKLWILGIMGVILAAVMFFQVKDTEIIKVFLNNMGKDGGIFNNVRFAAQRQALSQIFKYPMGGNRMDLILEGYCHNTWLDMANSSGIIPFFTFAAYTLFSFYELTCLLRRRQITTEEKLIVLGIYSSFFLFFTVEPAIDASIHYVAPWTFLNGMVHGKIESTKG